MMRIRICATTSLLTLTVLLATSSVQAAKRGSYMLLPSHAGGGHPFRSVAFTYGPTETIAGKACPSWELEIHEGPDPSGTPLCAIRGVSSRDPLAMTDEPMTLFRYQLRIPATSETYEYRNAHTGHASLPGWGDFTRYFFPQPARATGYKNGLPHTFMLLGHAHTLRGVDMNAPWDAWNDVKVLTLDRELWIATSRTKKDQEGHRLSMKPERKDYHYVEWTKEDYDALIEAGMNVFGVVRGLEDYVRSQPVFYRGGAEGLRYPADLYRSNFIGPVLYLDEPVCIMVGNKTIQNSLTYFTDAAALIRARVERLVREHTYELEEKLLKRDVYFGAMRLAQTDFVTWDTRYETAYYQFAAGARGFVHEGRHQLGEFNEFAKASTGIDREYTAEEMFRWYYGVMRGAARKFDGDWGTAIYGQADPQYNALAVTMAYDMGARFIWYWTSDHDHHLPFNEQIELSRTVKEHAKKNPRPSIRGKQATIDKLILIPYSYFLVVESPTGRKNCWDLWWVRELDPEGKNESSQKYRRLMRNVFTEMNKSLDAGESFDITVDDGREVTGYRKVIRVGTD